MGRRYRDKDGVYRDIGKGGRSKEEEYYDCSPMDGSYTYTVPSYHGMLQRIDIGYYLIKRHNHWLLGTSMCHTQGS